MSVDLKDSTAEVGYANIVSDTKEEDKIRGDFEELLKIAYGGKEDHRGGLGKPTSSTLYEEDGHLDGIARYSFKDSTEMLNKYEIKTDEKGDFIFDLSTESNRNLEYASGNGTYIEEGKKRFIRWDGNSASLNMKLKNREFVAKNRSLLPYWLEWKKKK